MLNRTIQIRGKQIAIEQDLSLSHAGTVWDGALVMAYFLQKNNKLTEQYLSNKNVLQLGSGTGFLGLSITTFHPKIVYLTDLPQFLNILQKNSKLNEQIWQQAGCEVKVKALKWGQKQDMQKFQNIDTIIGSQLAYDVENIGYLISTFLHFLSLNPKLMVMISYQKYENPQRNVLTRLKQIKQFQIEEVQREAMNEDYYDDYIGVLLITKNGQL